LTDVASHMGWTNPDQRYLFASVDGDFTYRLAGHISTDRLLHVEVLSGFFGDASYGDPTAVVADLRHVPGRDGGLEVSPDGDFNLVFSQEEQQGNWLPLPPTRAWVVIREYFRDWGEEPGDFSIEREGETYPPPPPSADDLMQRLDDAATRIRNLTRAYQRGCRMFEAAPQDRVVFLDAADYFQVAAGNFIHRGWGRYRCEPDHAVVLEVRPPRCEFWTFGLINKFVETVRFDIRQTSLNNRQAILDEDGVFRAVISHHDPGVPNWLDTTNYVEGFIGGRYILPESKPEPTLRTIELSKVRDYLPASTPIVNALERSEGLRDRRQVLRARLPTEAGWM
jgi:hypothetical protein